LFKPTSTSLTCLFICALAGLFNEANASDKYPMVMCVDHSPPHNIFTEHSTVPHGSLIDVAKNISKRLGIPITFTANTPFLRCLRMMRNGSADIMLGLLDKPERREYMHLYRYLDNSHKAFYALKSRNWQVNAFEDLAGLNIGVVHGFKYFPKFDRETESFSLNSAPSVLINLRRLLAGRVDLVIATKMEGDYIIRKNPNFQKYIEPVNYQYLAENPVFVGLSKRSRYADKAEELESLVATMKSRKEFVQIIDAYSDN